MTGATQQPRDGEPITPAGDGTGPDENELDPAKTGADQSQEDERSDAG
ncbi:hypothetical protein [Cellulomonas sp. URHE0023]|nr:hypothetical protein [Cellulomonas sp. URHE0023]